MSAVGDAVEPVDSNNNSEYSTDGQWGWYDAPVPPSGAFLVNVGLAMELWSGGAYKATLHRVVFPTPKEGTVEDLDGRYSIAYFVQPDDEVVGCVDRSVMRKEMLMGRVGDTTGPRRRRWESRHVNPGYYFQSALWRQVARKPG